MALGLLFHVPTNLGYIALAGLVGFETMGVPLPGETALIAAGILAADGRLEIELVVLVAAGAAIVGDNVGFWIGRRGGRKLLELPGPLQRHRQGVLVRGEAIFRRHGGKTVFFGRWFSGLRIASAWLAGVNRMPWGEFLVYNALGGIAWAVSVGLLAYWAGHSADDVLKVVGVGGLGVALVVLGAFLLWRWRRRRASSDV
ncbi:MAG TPA: DedA family protein [Thermoleophilaceae bacterium]|nr:DedA family protein [Thermoleophilaceae bacterium]